eukprot:6206938-Pleurochrysis_carterae.AAC.1
MEWMWMWASPTCESHELTFSARSLRSALKTSSAEMTARPTEPRRLESAGTAPSTANATSPPQSAPPTPSPSKPPPPPVASSRACACACAL